MMKIQLNIVIILIILMQLNCNPSNESLFIEIEQYQLVKENNKEFITFHCSTSLPKGTNVDIWYDYDCPPIGSSLTTNKTIQIDSNYFSLQFPIWFVADELGDLMNILKIPKSPQLVMIEFKINEEDNKKNEREIINLLKEEINNIIPYNNCYTHIDDSIKFANHYKDYFFSVGYIFEIKDDYYEKVYAPHCVTDTAFYYQKDLNKKN